MNRKLTFVDTVLSDAAFVGCDILTDIDTCFGSYDSDVRIVKKNCPMKK